MSILEEGAIKTLQQKKFLVTQISIDDDFNCYCYLLFYLIFDIYLRSKSEKINHDGLQDILASKENDTEFTFYVGPRLGTISPW